VSNVAVVDPSDKKPTRIKTRVETVERDGRQKASRVRVGVQARARTSERHETLQPSRA
jgi:large subunit ribosomal protein L24